MRILQVVPNFSPTHGGGGMAVVSQLSRALWEKQHEVTIYTSDFELDQDYIDSLEGVRVYPFHSWSNLMTFRTTPSIVAEARRRIRDFDVIHLHGLRTFQNIPLWYYAKKYGVPYVVDAHGVSNPRIGPTGARILKQLFDITFGYRILKDASRLIAETEQGVKEYKRIGVNQAKIVLLYPPRDLKEFSQLPPSGLFKTRYNIKGKHVILFLGSLFWVKGLDFLVKAFYQLAQERNDVSLVIVGPDVGYKSTLEKLIQKFKLSDKVLLIPFLGGEEKLSVLVDATISVQPSNYEAGLALSSLEAVMCGTPIIVTKNTGAGELVDKIDGGYTVQFGNTDELCRTMQHILNNPAGAATKTNKAKRYIEANLSISKRIVDYEELYAKCIEEVKKS